MENFAIYSYKAGNHTVEITEYLNHAVVISVDGHQVYSDGEPPQQMDGKVLPPSAPEYNSEAEVVDKTKPYIIINQNPVKPSQLQVKHVVQ